MRLNGNDVSATSLRNLKKYSINDHVLSAAKVFFELIKKLKLDHSTTRLHYKFLINK